MLYVILPNFSTAPWAHYAYGTVVEEMEKKIKGKVSDNDGYNKTGDGFVWWYKFYKVGPEYIDRSWSKLY